MKRIVAFVMVVVLVLSITACGDQSALVGKWYSEGSYDTPNFTFYSDGTCKVKGEYGSCKWDIVDSKLKITTFYGEVYVLNYEINGDKLVLKDEEEMILERR